MRDVRRRRHGQARVSEKRGQCGGAPIGAALPDVRPSMTRLSLALLLAALLAAGAAAIACGAFRHCWPAIVLGALLAGTAFGAW